MRVPQVGTFTPVLNNEGTDLAAALETIRRFGDREGLDRTVDDAFPGATWMSNGREDGSRSGSPAWIAAFASAAELSDGTLRYLLWSALY